MVNYPINLETFSKIVGSDNEVNIVEANISKQINFETKKELISLISWYMKEITKQKEKEILDTSKWIASILSNLDSYLKKIDLLTKNFIKISEALLLSDKTTLNALYMTKEEAIYSFTKYIYNSDWLFQKDPFINSSEFCHYSNLKQKAKKDIDSKLYFASNNESFICSLLSIEYHLNAFDVLYLWERLNDDLNFILNLYGENGNIHLSENTNQN